MAVDITLYKDQWSDSIAQLRKGTEQSILRKFCGYRKLAGDNAFVDSIGMLDADHATPADPTATASIRTRRVHADAVATSGANETAVNQAGMDTPHNEVKRQRTIFDAVCIEAGHWFSEIDDIQQIVSLKSPIIRNLMRKIARQEDKMVLAALRAASVSRQVNRSNTTVNMPSSQKVALEFETHANLLTEDGVAEVREAFVKNDSFSGELALCISPKRGKQLIQNSSTKIHSSDFVTRKHFESGDFPNILGFYIIEHPLCADNEAFAWAADAVPWGDFSGFLSDMASVPSQRFQNVAYCREFCDIKRVDDTGVVQINFELTSAS